MTGADGIGKFKRNQDIEPRGIARPLAATCLPAEILTIAEVAAELRCSKAHVSKAISGLVKNVTVLPAIPMGRRLLIRRSTLEQWERENERALAGAMMGASPKIHAVDA